jgi:type I restriction enzyme S subunit
MECESDFVALRDLSTRITKGTTPPRGKGFVGCGINYIKSEAISPDGSIDASKFAFIDEKTHSSLERSQLQVGNVLFSMAGVYLGKTSVVKAEHLPANTNQAVGIITLDGTRADPYFIHYVLQSPECRSWVARSAAQSAQPNFNLKEIGDLPIPNIPLHLQQDIGNCLKTIDDRIDLLRQTNTTLEAIAQALFKSWFVDFDPVHAKAEGREPEAMDAATAALFPSEFEDSELGLIPKGWRSLSFGDAATLSKGAVNPLTTPDTEFEHYSLPAFDAQQMPVHEAGEAIKSNKTPVPSGAVLVSKLNPHIPRVWPTGEVGANAVCSTEFLVWTPKAPASTAFVYCLASSRAFNSAMRQLVTGTSNSHQRVKPDQLKNIQVCPASDAALKAFATITIPLLQRMLDSRQQTATLASIRDTLLPRLIAGKLRLPEIMETAQEAFA